jgi:RHS repeat-associated protein
VLVPAVTLPPAPADLTACYESMGGPNVCNDLAWTGSSGVTYNVYRNSSSPVPIDAGHRIASGVTETVYTDCGRYKNYYYAVTAVNAEGESDPSNEAQASEPCGSAMAMTLPVLNAAALTESGGDPVVTKYFFFGGKRVAMDREGVVQWLVGDHLGSTSLVLDDLGSKVAESRHYPYGEERWRWPQEGTFPTDYRFTGQRNDSYIRLTMMGARWYDSELGRWISPDTIIPDFSNPQNLNRYSYCIGNPLIYIDPSGHYHKQIHKELTKKWVYQSVLQLGRRYGIGAEEAGALATNLAKQVSDTNQAVDCKLCPDSSARTSGVLHWMNHKEANANMAEVVQSGDPEAFGRALHAIQDYFSHFGQGFVLESEEDGRELYEKLLKQDDIDPSEHGGLDLETRLGYVEHKGHFPHRWPDDYDSSDAWDRLMRDESLYWIWLFVQIYFEENYGLLPEDEPYED